MTVYTSLIAAAKGLIAEYGKTVTLQQGTATPLDTNKPWRGNSPTTGSTAAPKGVVVSFAKEELDGDRITVSDLKLVVAADDDALSAFDCTLVVAAVVDGNTYGALLVQPVKPGSEDIVFKFRLRKDGQ